MLFEKVRDILAEQLEIDPESITLDTNIVDDLDADSLDFVEMITSIEDEFNIVVTDERSAISRPSARSSSSSRPS